MTNAYRSLSDVDRSRRSPSVIGSELVGLMTDHDSGRCWLASSLRANSWHSPAEGGRVIMREANVGA
jgi:hypothetical protein